MGIKKKNAIKPEWKNLRNIIHNTFKWWPIATYECCLVNHNTTQPQTVYVCALNFEKQKNWNEAKWSEMEWNEMKWKNSSMRVLMLEFIITEPWSYNFVAYNLMVIKGDFLMIFFFLSIKNSSRQIIVFCRKNTLSGLLFHHA